MGELLAIRLLVGTEQNSSELFQLGFDRQFQRRERSGQDSVLSVLRDFFGHWAWPVLLLVIASGS